MTETRDGIDSFGEWWNVRVIGRRVGDFQVYKEVKLKISKE